MVFLKKEMFAPSEGVFEKCVLSERQDLTEKKRKFCEKMGFDIKKIGNFNNSKFQKCDDL